MKTAEFTFVGSSNPPFTLKIQNPGGATIVDRILRDLPTGAAQAPPAVSILVTTGKYKITIAELKGSARGEATLEVE